MSATVDLEMCAVLTQLSLCSHAPTTGWDRAGGRSGENPGGKRPPGDLGAADYYARRYGPPFHTPTSRYPGAASDSERAQILDEATAELRHLRGHTRRPEPQGESRQDRDARIVREGEGFTAKEVARTFRCGVRDVQRARQAAEREPYTGKTVEVLANDEARRRARELAERGVSLRQIGLIVGKHKQQVQRYLGKRVA